MLLTLYCVDTKLRHSVVGSRYILGRKNIERRKFSTSQSKSGKKLRSVKPKGNENNNKNQSSTLVSACLALSLHALLESVSRWIFSPKKKKNADEAYLHHSKEAALLVFAELWRNMAMKQNQQISFVVGLNESEGDNLGDNAAKGN